MSDRRDRLVDRPLLAELAQSCGILPWYIDPATRERRYASAHTARAILHSLGVDASSESAIARSLRALGEAARLSAQDQRRRSPRRCVAASALLGRRQAVGVLVNLYTVRSGRNQGVGDLSDLETIVRRAAAGGAGFVGINPLHAIRARGDDISPYSPISRLFRSWLYLDLEAVPEMAAWRAAGGRAVGEYARRVEHLRRVSLIDYDQVSALKLGVLRQLNRIFRRRASDDPRLRAYRRYLARQGSALRDFATFCTLDAQFAGHPEHGAGWRSWPAALRDPQSAAVAGYRRKHQQDVDTHCFIQFELDRQLAACARRARASGMPIGLYQDLALGSARGGSDDWSFPSLFVDGVNVGAPPDAYSTSGQDWGFGPLDPRALARADYHYWRMLLRAGFAHAGALRIDHVLGLFRQYWIPRGLPASEGAYVRFPVAELLDVLGEESERAQAIVIGEDLGTVPPEVPRTLASRRILSSRVLYFEHTAAGRFRAASAYPRQALVTVNTHDLAPLAGWLAGTDIELRAASGAIRGEAEKQRFERERQAQVVALRRRLTADKLLAAGAGGEAGAFRDAVHAFLRQTPARLVGWALDDLAGEREPVNLPSVGLDRHRSWSRKMATDLEHLRL